MSDSLLKEDLFSKILLDPARNGASDLFIVSGYASSAMVYHHAEKLKEENLNVNINLIIGMACREGLSKSNHKGFQDLMKHNICGRFSCSYLIDQPTHSKVYSWVSGGRPITGFIGSANYSQQAFVINSQKEVATQCNCNDTYAYYDFLIKNTIYCNHNDADDYVSYSRKVRSERLTEPLNQVADSDNYLFAGLRYADVPLVSSKTKEVTPRSGLNWGQRPEYNRNPNQAYIQLRPEIYNSDFFPIRSVHFTVLTDDGRTLICTRAQKDKKGHAIETPLNNSLLGEYFRNRLGLSNGAVVTLQHLRDYGRESVSFYKIDAENYYMDFSKNTAKKMHSKDMP